MRKVLTILFVILILGCSTIPNQLDRHGNPIFNSIPIADEEFEGYVVSSNYYTIANNIANPNSSVFVSKQPTEKQLWEFCTNLPSYFWIIHKDNEMIKIIGLHENAKNDHKPEWSWFVTDITNNSSKEFKTEIQATLTEHRFLELSNPDNLYSGNITLMDKGSIIPFNGTMYLVVPYKEVYQKLKEFIDNNMLYNPEVNILSVIDK